MPSFARPAFPYAIDLPAELARLSQHHRVREVPPRSGRHLLLATWNIANLGEQDRAPEAYALLAAVMARFDVVAVQETKRNLVGLRALLRHLPARWRWLCTDVAGNNERLVLLYDGRKLRLREQVGEVAVPPSDFRHIRLPGVDASFSGMDRTAQLASFWWGAVPLTLVNVHLFFGSNKPADIVRRQLEAQALARWARLENASPHAYDPHVVLVGDFNLPYVEPEDPIFQVLVRQGLVLAPYATTIGTTLPSEVVRGTAQRVRHYDQIAFFPGTQAYFTGRTGVFDFDSVILPDLWASRGRSGFNAYLRFHLSDHRPLWTQVQVPPALPGPPG
jgi:endonuclease/exonuclease/phosphatase family metal-dependent hydrolase